MGKKGTYVCVGLESDAMDLQQLVDACNREPTSENLHTIGLKIRAFNLHLQRRADLLPKYENRGRTFTKLVAAAVKVSRKIPEQITRTDGGDRSVHALIARSAEEIRLLFKANA